MNDITLTIIGYVESTVMEQTDEHWGKVETRLETPAMPMNLVYRIATHSLVLFLRRIQAPAVINEIRTERSGLSSYLLLSDPESNKFLVSCVLFFDVLLHVLPTGRKQSLFRMR